MTRSSAARRNRSARRIVALLDPADVGRFVDRNGAFGPTEARVYATSRVADTTLLQEVSWPLVGELLNRMAYDIADAMLAQRNKESSNV